MFSMDVGHLCITRHETDFGFVTFQAISLVPPGNFTASGETFNIASHVQCSRMAVMIQGVRHNTVFTHHMIIWGSVTELPIDLCGSTWIVQYNLEQQYTIK